jgi:pteridine reductase
MTQYKKVAFVTGSAKRIGNQTVRSLHAKGYRTIIHCNRSTDEAQVLVDELNQVSPNTAQFVTGDLTQHSQYQKIADDVIAAFGRLDVLVNNASSFYPTVVGETLLTEWDDLISTNLKAPFFLIQAFKQQLEQTNGCVINMIDIHAERPLKGYSVYCMAKAGLAMLTKSLSRELAPNIRVNGIAPGAILWHENDLNDQDKQQVISEISLQRLGSPEDIAQAILYLIDANYVTGQIIAVDGGRSNHGGEKA